MSRRMTRDIDCICVAESPPIYDTVRRLSQLVRSRISFCHGSPAAALFKVRFYVIIFGNSRLSGLLKKRHGSCGSAERELNYYDQEEEDEFSPTIHSLMKLEEENKLDAHGKMVSGSMQTLCSLILEDRDALLDQSHDEFKLVTVKDQFLETSEAALVAGADAEEKEIQALVYASSSSAANSCMNGDGHLSLAQTAKILRPIVAASPGPDDLTNELKTEIEYMKSQLPKAYSETFAGLQLGRELGCGTFGRVYEATTRFEKVAIKVFRAEKMATLSKSEYYMNMNEFYWEALLLSKMNHPNIMSFKFIVPDVASNGIPGMATELMPDDLFRFIHRAGGPKSWRTVWSIAKQVAEGMKYMHSKNVVHFDIKSSNVLLNYDTSQIPNILTCKVADFGHAMENHHGVMYLDFKRGTTRYMAPEVLRASQTGMELVTDKVDVYSYGVLLWELIMGVLPYDDKSNEEIGPFVMGGSRPPMPNWCDIGWRTLMEDCWSQNPSQRPSFDKIVMTLDSLLGSP